MIYPRQSGTKVGESHNDCLGRGEVGCGVLMHTASFDAVVRDSLAQTVHATNQSIEYGRYRQSIEDVGVAKSYLARNLYFRIRVKRGDSPVWAKFGDWYAIIEATRPGCEHHSDNAISRLKVLHPGELTAICGRDEFDMLVDVSKAEDGVEVVVPSRVGLLSKDEFDKVGVQPFYFPFLAFNSRPGRRPTSVPRSAFATCVKDQLLRSLPAWEVNLGKVPFADVGHDGEADGDLIKARAEMVDYLRSQHVNHLRWRVGHADLSEPPPGFGVWGGVDKWLALLPEYTLPRIQLAEQFLCTLNFERWSKEV